MEHEQITNNTNNKMKQEHITNNTIANETRTNLK